MFSKSDIQHLDKQYEELANKLDQLHEFTRHGFNSMRQDHDDEYEKLRQYFKKYYYFIAGDKMPNEDLGYIDHEWTSNPAKPPKEIFDDLGQVYSLIFKRGDADENLSGKFNKKDYYRVDVAIQDAIDTEINAILLKHILNYANNPKITVNKIQTIVSSPRKIYAQGSAIETLDYVPEKVNGFFYDQNVVGYSTLSFANNDRLISFIKIDNLENKSKTEMKNLTQFEVE